MIENLTEMVLKFFEEVGKLYSDNIMLKAKIECICTTVQPCLSSCVQEPLSQKDVTSSVALKDRLVKTYKDVLSVGCAP
jgi:hypothetical protein